MMVEVSTMKTKELDEQQLIEGLKSHDPKIIDEFVAHFSRPLFGIILNYTKNPSDAEELLQDTLLKIIRKIDTFREESTLWPWIKRITVNNSIMWLRKNRTRRQRQVNLEDMGPHFSEEGYYQGPTASWPLDPEDVMLNSELSSNLYEAIQSLPFEYRMPMVLRDIEGYPMKQISSLLGLKEATAKTRVHRARLFVREKLANYFEGK